MNNTREHLRCSRRGCSYTTNRSYNLERHERNHEKGKVPVSQCQPCPHCTYAAGSLHNLMRHIGKKHAILSIKKQKEQLSSGKPHQLKEFPPTEQSTPQTEAHSEQEELPVQQALAFCNSQHSKPPLWYWSTPQQQEKNFLRRSALNGDCKILDWTVKMFKLYSLVKARGGAAYVDDWDNVAAALGLPPGSGPHVRAKYMDVLIEFEKNEEERVQEYAKLEGVPAWWDDGDFIVDNETYTSDETQLHCQCYNSSERPTIPVKNVIVEMIYNKYYKNYVNNSKPFQRFHLRDSWLSATELSYKALTFEMHFKHYTDPGLLTCTS